MTALGGTYGKTKIQVSNPVVAWIEQNAGGPPPVREAHLNKPGGHANFSGAARAAKSGGPASNHILRIYV